MDQMDDQESQGAVGELIFNEIEENQQNVNNGLELGGQTVHLYTLGNASQVFFPSGFTGYTQVPLSPNIITTNASGQCFGRCCTMPPVSPVYPVFYPPNNEVLPLSPTWMPMSQVMIQPGNSVEFPQSPTFQNMPSNLFACVGPGSQQMWPSQHIDMNGNTINAMSMPSPTFTIESRSDVPEYDSTTGLSNRLAESSRFTFNDIPSPLSSVPSSPTSIPNSLPSPSSGPSTPDSRGLCRLPSRRRIEEPVLLPRDYTLIDCNTTFIMNGVELPYVMNVYDPNSIWNANRSLNLEYYVPPVVDDFDFFGGQQQMWQIKMIQYFGKFRPDIWKLQAVPDFKKNQAEGWVSFPVTSKLRFCCRACRTPWTSKQGQILFVFLMDPSSRLGWIFMKIFGQICMKKKCKDQSYQTPACYPEEIDRAVLKLSDYIGFIHYAVPLPDKIFEECKKSIRITGACKGRGAENQHRKELCQACTTGMCRGFKTETAYNR